MDKNKSIALLIIIFIGCFLIAFKNFNNEKTIEENIRIGVSDDTSGFVINYMKNKEYLENVNIENIIEPYSISDC